MKRTTKGLALLLALVLIAALTACGQQPAAPTKSVYDRGQEVVALMAEMAGSELYASLYTTDQEMLSVLADAGKGDFSTPAAVYSIRMPESTLATVAEAMGVTGTDGLSDGLKKAMNARILSALPTQINAMGGSTVLAASSLCSASKTFVSTELGDNTIYLYTYENAVPAAVTFTVGEDNTVTASGTLILNDSFGGFTLDQLQGVFGAMGAEIAEVTQ